jgi:polyhydroxybutyrate depolymerase
MVTVMVTVMVIIVTLVTPSPATAAAAGRPRVAPRPSPGCRLSTPVAAERTLSFDADTVDGTYLTQGPSTTAPGQPLPVIFDLHGYQEPGSFQETLSGLGLYGESHGFMTVTPWIDDQLIPQWLSRIGSRNMNWFGGLLSHVEATACVDENRVFVTGYSNGAFMTSAIACQYSSRVAAVAPVAGIQAVRCRTERPVPVVAFHGTADPLVHYNGTASKVAQALPAPDGSVETDRQKANQLGVDGAFISGPSIPAEAASWAKRNRCSSKKTIDRVAGRVSLLSWSCPHGANVELFRIQGGGHTWPGSKESAALASILGPTTFEISADAQMWQFFRTHPLTSSD